ncbi:hypothetical protein KP509_31G069800 [Ceratopteris richardii]|nr:hypothetical protein KP509_31G069800 [Ceratopteris richardii]
MQDTKQNYMDPMSTFWDRSLPLGAEVSAPPLQDSANEWIDSGNTDIPGNIEQEASLLKAKGERFEFQKQKTDNSSVAKRHPLQGTVSVRTEAQKQKMDSSFGGQSYVMQERASIRTEGSIRSKELPSQSYDRQGTERKNTSYDSPKYLLQRSEQTTKHQVSSHQDTESQQGYGLANMDRASGLDRKKRKEFTLRTVVANQASTLSYIQIFGTGFDTGDTMPTLLLFFDRRRFLFNVGEGFHRFSNEHKFKLSKVDHVFLTRVCTETIGGLPGLILSLAEINETVKTWGPSSLNDFAKAARIFVPSGWLEHTHSFGPGINDDACLLSPSSPPIFLMEDELIKISAVLLSSEHAALNKANYASSTDERKGNMLSAVYICELSTVRGKFDPVKARSKGLSPGRKYGLLQRGESVLSDDGTKMVHPEDVLGPSSPGPIVLVVDCPSASYISSLINSASLQSFFPGSGKVVNCMIHIGPPSVTSLEAYQSWMENFKVTDHIMARREMSVLGEPTLTSSVKLRSRLNMVCPWFFPSVEVNDETQKPAVNSRMAIGKNLLKYRLRPLADLGLDTSEVLEGFDSAAFQKEMATDVMKAQEMAQEIWKRWSEGKFISSLLDRGTRGEKCLPACLHDVSREEMEVVFLGTGSSQPSKHRNVTGIYIHLFERGGLLLDCGEGTFAQLKRRYGAEGADNVLMGLKCIWISHMHADHFLGLGRILSARKELLERCSIYDPLLVVGPKLLKSFLDSYGKIEDLMMEFLDCSQTTLEAKKCADNGNVRGGEYRRGSLIHGSLRTGERNRMQHIWNLPGYHISRGIDMEGRRRLRSVLSLLGLKDLISVPVIHCLHAFGVVLEAEDRRITENARKPGWKLVFSGDTRPCQALVDAAQGATILIHEATFDDALIADAVKKNHSITKEAIQVGVHAGVYRIFLTHFSQRYPKIPAFDNRFHDRTCFAFDMMSVNLADLPVVPEFVPALQTLFQDQSDTEEDAEETTAVCP